MTEVATTRPRVSQATAIEQTRAATEVQAAVVAARAVPRDVQQALADMRETCGMPGLANKAFFSFPRGRETVAGPTIHLARELARVWGNIDYAIAELSRHDDAGESEMRATAWDMQTNARSSTTFIVKHEVDTKSGRKKLVDLRDVYENNANLGARRVREMIFALLPTWFTDEAKDRCAATLRDPGDGKTLPQRVADLVKNFESFGVTPEPHEARVGKAASRWSDIDVAQLKVIGATIHRGEGTVDEFFARVTERVTAADLKPSGPAGGAYATKVTDAPPAGGQTTAEHPDALVDHAALADTRTQIAEPTAPEDAPRTGPKAQPDQTGPADDPADDGPVMAPRNYLTKIAILARELGIYAEAGAEGREEYLAQLSAIALVDVTSATELTKAQAKWVIDRWTQLVEQMPKPDAPAAQVEDTSTREQRLEVYHLIVDQAVAAGHTEADAKAKLEQHYALPVAELTLDQLTGYSQRHPFAPKEG
jgi:hypothetical protein